MPERNYISGACYATIYNYVACLFHRTIFLIKINFLKLPDQNQFSHSTSII